MTDFADVLATVQSRASYFRCATDAEPGRDGWIGCADLIADPTLLRGEIDATAEGRQSDDAQVLASLFVQSYAFRIPSVAVAAWALGLPAPSVAPDATLMRITRHRPGELAIVDRTMREHSAATLVEEVIDGHLEPFISAARAVTKVGRRLLLGNVAASMATIFRAMESDGLLGDLRVRDRAEEFFAAAPQLADLGHWSTIDVLGASGWFWDRSACCLWYQTATGSLCDDCSLHDDAERHQRRRAELVVSAEAAT